jgi:hypothetical protein
LMLIMPLIVAIIVVAVTILIMHLQVLVITKQRKYMLRHPQRPLTSEVRSFAGSAFLDSIIPDTGNPEYMLFETESS